MANSYALCTNVGKCRKTGPNDIVAFDPTIGGVVVCSECGRRLTPVAGSPERFAAVPEFTREEPLAPSPQVASAPPSSRSTAHISYPRLVAAISLLIVASLVARLFYQHAVAVDSLATIRVCGSSTATSRLADDFARQFFQMQGGHYIQTSIVDGDAKTISTVLGDGTMPARIQISGQGSSRGFAALANGQCDLVISLRPIHDDEAASISGIQGRAIGRDAIVVAVSPAGYVDRLTDEQVRQIFSGQITQWSQVGGPNRRIDVIAPDDSSEYETLRDSLLDDRDPVSAAQEIPMANIADALASDPDAIAIDSYSALGSARAITIVGRLSTLVPSSQNFQTGAYPFSPHLYVYTARESTPPALLPTFVAYLRSAAAGSVLSSDGLIANR
ncbi:MAG TPA: substrate-binding domain-containing protein [Candidatus Acidoferrales bacterium]|nr:substrate-binding domain-containing protein [Candidatus Acidoferrales bacterium]